jgi:hypothetical protein
LQAEYKDLQAHIKAARPAKTTKNKTAHGIMTGSRRGAATNP